MSVELDARVQTGIGLSATQKPMEEVARNAGLPDLRLRRERRRERTERPRMKWCRCPSEPPSRGKSNVKHQAAVAFSGCVNPCNRPESKAKAGDRGWNKPMSNLDNQPDPSWTEVQKGNVQAEETRKLIQSKLPRTYRLLNGIRFQLPVRRQAD